ncbi:hypothetical protein [Brevifollis gellanilyticus]|uniref:Uncharacterized protein n=1 Tax=Brevifollis gellanilyticus TaxID=748831 RepID=A0A512M9P0_9BACT|nr:hypothetical protein [Brevifollis gellanilyticus]GEP43041.1 hypothetical protein BGE01nite_23320 [Brevifollis gellanilyticus]
MSDSPPVAPGRFIRYALVFLPLGLIITSIISFGIWWTKKQSVEERSYAYATALRSEMTLPSLERYTGILREVMQPQGLERLSAVASFIDSSMSAENMGYAPKRDRFFDGGLEQSNVYVELTGKQRPYEVRLILVPYGAQGRGDVEIQALAGMMSLGHALAGARGDTTLRMAAVPLGVKDPSGRNALERLAASMLDRQERIMQVTVLGGVDGPLLEEVKKVFKTSQTGTVIESLPATLTHEETLKSMTGLKARF